MKNWFISLAFTFSFQVILLSQSYDIQWIQGDVPVSIMDFRNDTIDFHYISNNIVMFNTAGNICDKEGKFLFFTNGIYIRDKNGNIMPNGDSLSFYNPALYSTMYDGAPQDQGVLILPKPKSDSLYYIFHYVPTDTSYMHLGETYKDPLFFYYSIVDITTNNGLGSLIQKNIRLPIHQLMCASRLTAVKHGNGQDWWVIRHGQRDNTYIKFLVTSDTIWGPYLQNIGPDFNHDDRARDFYGASVFSLAGDRMATGNWFGPLVVLNFDRCTGNFNNPLVLGNQLRDTTVLGVAGLAFSPDGRFLYANNIYELNQYDLWSSNPNDSIRLYSVDTSDYYWMGAMQLAPNGKIYVSTWNGGTQALHVINRPDSLGLTCDFQFKGQSSMTVNTWGLPNMVNYRLGRLKGSVCDTLPYLIATGIVTNSSCYGACDGAIQISHTGGLQPPFYYKWSNDSTTKNLSSLCAGIYTVTVTDMWDTSIVTFTITQPDSLFITIDSVINDNGSNNGAIAISVAGGTPPYTFQWNNTNTTEDINQLSFGTYSVNITDAKGCSTVGNVTVEFIDAVFERIDQLINIYPNPVSDELYVSFPEMSQEFSIIMTDITGKQILQTSSEIIPVSHLDRGLYFMKIEFQNGKYVLRKVLVQ